MYWRCAAQPRAFRHNVNFGAGEGNRTLVVSLEGFCSTIELHPRARCNALILRFLRVLGNPQIRFHLATQQNRHGIAVTVARLAGRNADPTFADAVFLDVRLLDPIKAKAHAALQQRRIVVRATRVVRKTVGKSCHEARGGRCLKRMVGEDGFEPPNSEEA